MPDGAKVAMLSYNTFLNGRPNGWIDDKLFLIQDDNGASWGAQQRGPINQMEALKALGDQTVKTTVASHWDRLVGTIPEFDAVVIYVGDRGSEHTIEHAAAHGLNPDKAVFVLCDCNMGAKEAAISRYGFGNSRRLMCECGGHDTMRQLAIGFLETGQLPLE